MSTEALSLRAIESRNPFERILLYRKIISQGPDSPLAKKARYQIAFIYYLNGFYSTAEREFLKSLHLIRGELKIKSEYYLGRIFLMRGRYKESKEHFSNGINGRYIEPIFAHYSQIGYGELLLAQERFEEAEKLFLNVFEGDFGRDNSRVIFLLGLVYFRWGRLIKAKRYMMEIVSRHPDSVEYTHAKEYLSLMGF